MIKARRQREIERNKLLDELMSMVSRLEDSVYLELAEVIIKYLQSKQRLEKRNEVTRLFFNGIVPRVNSFVRAEEEIDFIYAELLKKVLDLALTPFYDALLGLETCNPQLIFGVDTAMTQQKLPEEKQGN